MSASDSRHSNIDQEADMTAVESIRPRLGLGYFTPGARWTFVHSDGKRTDYIFDRVMLRPTGSPDGKLSGLAGLYALLNPVTLKEAQVTDVWLRKGPQPNGGWWLAVAEAGEAEAA